MLVDVVGDIVRVPSDVIRDRRQLVKEALSDLSSILDRRAVTYDIEERLIICGHDANRGRG
jgi:hypothetical protein